MAYFTSYFTQYFDADAAAVATVVAERPSGGWLAYNDRQLARLLRKRLKLEDEEDAVEAALEAAGVEIPISVATAKPEDLTRLRGLVTRYAQTFDTTRRTTRAVEYAQRAKTALAYEQALREIARAIEEDEISLMVALASIA